MNDPAPYRPYAPGTQPPLEAHAYRGTIKRHPLQPLHPMPQTLTEITGPSFSPARYPPTADLTATGTSTPLGERILVAGRIADEDGRPVAHTMVEIWQANAAGRYNHPGDTHDAPIDANFRGAGSVFTDADGNYSMQTIRPGANPWPNGPNSWRPSHIHFSFFGPAFATRLVTQMYFEGDPLLRLDPVFMAVPDAAARARLVAPLDMEVTRPGFALGYRFDVVLRGRGATPMEDHR